MKCRIVKVGRGVSTPSKYRPCHICHGEISDFRFEIITEEGPNECYHVSCLAEFYFNVQPKWWFKLFSRFSKMKIKIETGADGSEGSDNID